jgi:hypothetical protein
MNRIYIIALTASAILLAQPSSAAVQPDGRGYPTADAAAKALVGAATRGNVTELIAILGPSSREILITSDPVADRKARVAFVKKVSEKMKIVPDPNDPNVRTVLIGADDWPMPIPIVRVNGKWYFDVGQGKEEILNRRIGSNELDAIEVSRGYVEAQNTYAGQGQTNGGASRYADRIMSSPGKHDGLYWSDSDGSNASPIGDIVAKAFSEGYTTKGAPYHGYYFKVLKSQGPHASGGEMSYLDDKGDMTRGFALIAWPSDYGSTGIMTFIVDKSGIVYQKDLGPQTAQTAGSYTAYDPDDTWTPVQDSLPQ